jgi:multiple sugar transport system permease protein
MGKMNTGNRLRLNKWGYFFVAPFVLVFCVFNLWPTLYTFVLSFTNLKGIGANFSFTGFANFSRLLRDKNFFGAIGNTLIISWCTFIPQLLIALLLAIWFSDIRLNLKGRGLFRGIIFLPYLLTAASIAVLFRNFFMYPAGLFNKFLYDIGIRQTVLRDGELVTQAYDYFRNVIFSRGLTSFILWWVYYGSTNIILMAGITGINPALYESAVVDGANSRQTTWYITLPLLRPIMLYVFFTSMIGGMQVFDIPYLLTGGGPDNSLRTMMLYVYSVGFQGANDKAYAAAISVGIFIITMILALIIFFFLQDRSELRKKENTGGSK